MRDAALPILDRHLDGNFRAFSPVAAPRLSVLSSPRVHSVSGTPPTVFAARPSLRTASTSLVLSVAHVSLVKREQTRHSQLFIALGLQLNPPTGRPAIASVTSAASRRQRCLTPLALWWKTACCNCSKSGHFASCTRPTDSTLQRDHRTEETAIARDVSPHAKTG